MTWQSLGTEVQQVFHELMGYEEYQQDLFSWAMRKRRTAAEAQQRYESKPAAIDKRRDRQRAYWARKHPPRKRHIVRPAAVREAHRLKMRERRAAARAA